MSGHALSVLDDDYHVLKYDHLTLVAVLKYNSTGVTESRHNNRGHTG